MMSTPYLQIIFDIGGAREWEKKMQQNVHNWYV